MARKFDERTGIDGQKPCLKRLVFKVCLKEECLLEWPRLCGRSFQVAGPKCRNDLSANAFEPVRGILSRRASAEERSSLEGVYKWISSELYCGPEPGIAL